MSEEKNILILALSTFPSKLFGTSLVSPTGDDLGTYHYQLEPVPMMLMHDLQQKGGKLDSIVVFATPETQKEVSVTIDNGPVCGISASAYFAQFVKQYGGEKAPEVKLVPLDEKAPEYALQEAITYLREFANARIYLDTHGGYRGLQLMTEAVLSLLRTEGIRIRPENVYSMQYNAQDGVGRIVVDGSPYRIFDFVSGMNEFINYGRVDSLNRYFSGNAGATERKLLNCIKEISEGIQLCLVPKFEHGLDNLMQVFQQPDAINNTYLEIFRQTIEEDYKNLLVPNRNLVDELEWCLRKGFYQQFLTLIESKVPELLFYKNMVQFSSGITDGEKLPLKKKAILFNNCNRVAFDIVKAELAKKIEECAEVKLTEDETRRTLLLSNVEDIAGDVELVLPCANYENLLLIHVVLKLLRNTSNHAGERVGLDTLSTDKVKKCCRNYLALLRIILDRNYTALYRMASEGEEEGSADLDDMLSKLAGLNKKL